LFTIAGTPDECREKLARYSEVLTHVVLHTPYAPPLTADDSRDAFDAILQTFGSRDTSAAAT
jgi:alkanesulfonate monooxygenase SsuD/methylene tetrahydromethanopterin reductase-like flavin-dependent oxidoreductase (luciferase family)